MRVLAVPGVVLAMAAALPAQVAMWPKIQLSQPEDKELKVVQHFVYRSRLYMPPVELGFLRKAPEVTRNAEEALQSLLSAQREADYDWWLGVWDGTSREKLLEREKAAGRTEKAWIADWKAKSGSMRYTLVEWILRGGYVILTYQVTTLSGPQKSVRNEIVSTAFKVVKGWQATLDLEQDPVFLHHGEGKSELERVVPE